MRASEATARQKGREGEEGRKGWRAQDCENALSDGPVSSILLGWFNCGGAR